jgi:hypothetical protein
MGDAAGADAAAADAYVTAARRATPASLPLLRALLQRNVRARAHACTPARLHACACALRTREGARH